MFSNPHNIVSAPKGGEQRHGIRVSLADNDPFQCLLAENWEAFHWFTRTTDRDEALADMSRRHEYSRIGDAPTLHYEAVER